jgi:hypothetical protein
MKVGTVVPMHDELKPGTLHGILKLVKVDPEEFFRRLGRGQREMGMPLISRSSLLHKSVVSGGHSARDRTLLTRTSVMWPQS